jgi:hypothetical protein
LTAAQHKDQLVVLSVNQSRDGLSRSKANGAPRPLTFRPDKGLILFAINFPVFWRAILRASNREEIEAGTSIKRSLRFSVVTTT